jgi:endonuclease/exonuclease/phosphatase family metal-dependent hydrolase
MKHFNLTSILRAGKIALTLLVLVAFFSGQQLFAQESSDLRIMCYNIRNGRGLDNKTDYARIAETIKKENPDVVALQEIDKKTTRSNGVDVLEELAKLTDMTPSYGAAIDFQGGQYGVGVLSKEEPINVERFPLPGAEEKRLLLVVEFEDFVFCCSHWSLTAEDRNTSAALVTSKMKEQQKPVFICGDFNAEPTEDSISALKSDWTILSADEPTFPADNPTVRIDYICAADPQGKIDSERWLKAAKNARVVNEPVASDHRPIALEISRDIFK